MTEEKDILSEVEVEVIIKDILTLSKEFIGLKENAEFVTKYLNKKRLGLTTALALNGGLIPPGISMIIPRISLIPKLKTGLKGADNTLIFPCFRSGSVESFLGVLRNTNEFKVKHLILKLKNDGDRFFHWGVYPKHLIIVEGITDKMRLMQSDIVSVPSNGTEFDIDKLKEFKEAKEITLFLDGDSAGRIKTLDLVSSYLFNKKDFNFELTVVNTPKDLDPCDLKEKEVKRLCSERELAEDYFKSVIKKSLDSEDLIQSKLIGKIEKNLKKGASSDGDK